MGTSRRRHSASEQQELVRRWRESGQSKASFARKVGISVNTLRRWLSSSEPAFVEVVEAEPVVPVRDFMVHIGHVCVQVPPGFEARELQRLLAVVC